MDEKKYKAKVIVSFISEDQERMVLDEKQFEISSWSLGDRFLMLHKFQDAEIVLFPICDVRYFETTWIRE